MNARRLHLRRPVLRRWLVALALGCARAGRPGASCRAGAGKLAPAALVPAALSRLPRWRMADWCRPRSRRLHSCRPDCAG
eukprot:5283177-Alexandrium_andersonii.AAC.1